MAKRPLPSPEVLRQLLRYEPDTGKLFWLPRGPEWFSDKNGRGANAYSIFRASWANKEAFTCIGNHGYYNGAIFGRTFLAHRVIWALVTGNWPKEEIDHINGVRTDNAISNLREATRLENAKNVRGRLGTLKGASWHKQCRKWRAQIKCDGSHKDLGLFETEKEAHDAYCKAAVELHGEFARTE